MSKFTKRILSTLMVVCMLVGMCLPGLTVSAANDILAIDFESDTIGAAPTNAAIEFDATVLDDNDTVTVVADPKNSNNKVLELKRTDKKYTVFVKVPEQTGAFALEYRIMFDGLAQCAAVMQQGTNTKKLGAYLLARPGTEEFPHSLEYHDGAGWQVMFAKEEFKNNEWYSVKFNIDVKTNKFDISVTDPAGVTKTANNVGFRNSGLTTLDYLSLQFAGGVPGVLYVDDIKITDPNAQPETPPVDPDTPETPETPETPDYSKEIAELQKAISKVESDLAKATEDLTKAIADGDKALDTKITALNEAVEAAKKAYAAADTAMQNTLTAKIEAADKTLDDAIKAVQKNLTDAKTALEAADKKNADDLAKAIGDLNTAINAAKAAATTADGAVKTELSAKIDNADETLKASIDTLTAELQSVKQALEAKDTALETKDAELESLIGTVRIIAIAAICLSVISIVFAFIGKKKKA